MSGKDKRNNIIVALDFDEELPALVLAQKLDPKLCRLKVGKELFTSCGPSIVEKVQNLGFDVFLDLKFHDIPNTVAKAVSAAAGLGVWMVNVHASGGRSMMLAARNALETFSTSERPSLIAVTALTSMDANDLLEVGFTQPPEQLVERLASLVKECGLDGVVCSSREVKCLKKLLGENFVLVTPGIRPLSSVTDDQKRTMTPADAVMAGSDYLVIGRPITQSTDPLKALQDIVETIIR